jgi:hypothetical protein
MKWFKPLATHEHDEIQRTSKELEIAASRLIEAFNQGNIVTLSAKTCELIDNFDCEISRSWWLTLCLLMRKRWKDVLYSLWVGEMEAPIILEQHGKSFPYLISGNTRLCVCRVLGIQIRAWWIKI